MAQRSRDLHVAHMQAIEQIEHIRTLSWSVALAGLSALRLVDAWAEREGHLPPQTGADVENDPDWVGAAELAVQLIDPDAPIRRVLHALVHRTAATVGRPDAGVLMHLLAYADHLRRESIWPLAIDAYQAVIRHAHNPQELALLTGTFRQLGTCLRMEGRLEEALRAYTSGSEMAHRHHDVEGELRLRNAEANIHILLTQYDQAESTLRSVQTEAEAFGLSQVRARALHDRAVVAILRKDMMRAIQLLNEAFGKYENPASRERAVFDLAVVAMEFEREAARQAFVAIYDSSTDYGLRAIATLNLLEIAHLDGDHARFDRYRRELATVRLPEAQAAKYYMTVGKGHRRFGNEVLAVASFNRAKAVAERANVVEVLNELSELPAPSGESIRAPLADPSVVRLAVTTLVAFAEGASTTGQP